jgi:hypothetical protein
MAELDTAPVVLSIRGSAQPLDSRIELVYDMTVSGITDFTSTCFASLRLPP